MGMYTSSLRGVEYTQQVGLPTAEIDDIFQGDNEYIYAGDDQDNAQGYDAISGQYFWRLPAVAGGNEPIFNVFNGAIGETVTTPAAGVLANTENTIVVWGGTGAVASYTYIQGGVGVTSGTNRFRALTNSLGVDIDINVVTPVIDIGADVLASGIFIDIGYDTGETTDGTITVFRFSNAAGLTLGGDLLGIDLDFSTSVTVATDQDITGYNLTLPAFTQSAANTTTYIGYQIDTAGALVQDTAAGTINHYGINLVAPASTISFAASTIATTMLRVGTAGALASSTSGTHTWLGADLVLPASTTTGTATTTIGALRVGTAGAVEINTGAAITNWFGTSIQLPVITETTGTITAYGHSALLTTIPDAADGGVIAGYHFTTAADTNSSATNHTYRGVYNPTSGALVQDTAAGTLNWYAIDLVAPQSTISFAASTISTTILRVGTAGALASSTSGTHQWFATDLVLPATTATGTATTNVAGLRIGTAGAVEINTGAATTSWRGTQILVPDVTQTTGTITAYGHEATLGDITTGGTVAGYNLITPAKTNSTANSLHFRGWYISSAGTIIQDTAAGTLRWTGFDLTTPTSTLSFAAGQVHTVIFRLATANPVASSTAGTQNWVFADTITPTVTVTGTATTTVAGFRLHTAGALSQTTAAGTINWYGTEVVTPISTTSSALAATINVVGNRLATAGALTTTDAGNVVNWTGQEIQMPNMTQTGGTLTVVGLDIDVGTVTSGTVTGIDIDMEASYSGTQMAISITGDGRTVEIANTSNYLALSNSGNGVDVNINETTPVIDIGADVLVSGIFIDIGYDTAESTTGTLTVFRFTNANTLTVGGDVFGIDLDFGTNVTAADNHDITGYVLSLPALAQSTAVTTNYRGFFLDTAGAISDSSTVAFNWFGADFVLPQTTVTGTATAAVAGFRVASSGNITTTTAAGTINWRGLDMSTSVGTVIANFAGSTIDWRAINVDMPDITETAGTATADGLRIQTGAYTSGTARFWRLTDNAGAIMSDFIMNDGTITHATLRIYDSGGTDYISFYDNDSVSFIASNPNGIAIAPSNDVDDYILFTTPGDAPGFTSIGDVDLAIQNQAAANPFDVTFFNAQTVPAATPAAGSTPEIRIYGWSSATINVQVYSAIWTGAVPEGHAETNDEIGVMHINPANSLLILSNQGAAANMPEIIAGVTHATLRIYDSGWTDYIQFYDDDSYSYVATSPNPLRFTHGSNSGQSQNHVCGFATEPTLAGGAVLMFTSITGTAWASGNYTGGNATAGSWLLNDPADEIMFALPLPELFVDTGVAGELILGLTYTTTNATDRFDYAIYDEDGTVLVDEVDQTLGATSGTFTINLGALAIVKGNALVVALIGFETTAPAATTATITQIELTYEVGIENNVV